MPSKICSSLILALIFAPACYSNYSLTNLPDADSSDLSDTPSVIDAEKLATSLQQLGKHAEIAYYATIAYQTAGFSSKAQSIHEGVSSLHQASLSTFGKFQEKSSISLGKLQEAFKHLEESKQDQAHTLLSEVGGEAEGLGTEAHELYGRAASERDKVKTVLQEIYDSRGTQVERKASIERQEKELVAQKARIEQERQNAENAAAESHRQADQAQRDADYQRKKRKKKCKGLSGKIKCAVTDVEKKHRKRERSYRDEAARHLANANAQQTKFANAQAQLNQILTTLNEARNKIKSIEDTASGLQQIEGEYSSLTVALQSTNVFWNDMVGRCQHLQKEILKEQLPSEPFQDQAVRLYMEWLSLNKESKYFLGQLKPMLALSSGKPTVDEAQKKIQKIKDEL